MSIKEEDQKDAGVSSSFKVGDIVRIVSGDYLGELGTVTWVCPCSDPGCSVSLEISDRIKGKSMIGKFSHHLKHVFKTDAPKRPRSVIIQEIHKLLDELES